jgi:hypothetical protein
LSQKVAGECVSLLEAMDLDGEDDESEDLNNMNEVLLQEDGEQVHLPDEWIYDLHTNNKVLKLCWIKLIVNRKWLSRHRNLGFRQSLRRP